MGSKSEMNRVELRHTLNQIGRALGDLYQWNTTVDVEALQVLLCISMLELDEFDRHGRVPLIEVKGLIGISHDRMTRCLRLLLGQSKSKPLITTEAAKRTPLIDVHENQNEGPFYKKISLTSEGRQIIENFLDPMISPAECNISLQRTMDIQSKRIRDLENRLYNLGFSIRFPKTVSSDEKLYTEKSLELIRHINKDVFNLSLKDLYNLGLPSVNQFIDSLSERQAENHFESEELQSQWEKLTEVIDNIRMN